MADTKTAADSAGHSLSQGTQVALWAVPRLHHTCECLYVQVRMALNYGPAHQLHLELMFSIPVSERRWQGGKVRITAE